MPGPAKYTQPIHFEDFSGNQFERLVFAYHVRTERWLDLEWYGQSGKDDGRDIIGTRLVDGRPEGESICILCANWKSMTLKKIKDDIDALCCSPTGTPDRVRAICGSNVTASIRDGAKAYAALKSISFIEIWSGQELEEHIRSSTESLLARFSKGEEFPDAAAELKKYVLGIEPLNDAEALAQLARVFDRPAFYTRIMEESSLPDFRQAIDDSIRAIGTGIWQTREGEVLARLRSRHDFKDPAISRGLQKVEQLLAALRRTYDQHLREGAIKSFNPDDPACFMYWIAEPAADDLEQLRTKVLEAYHDLYPAFELNTNW